MSEQVACLYFFGTWLVFVIVIRDPVTHHGITDRASRITGRLSRFEGAGSKARATRRYRGERDRNYGSAAEQLPTVYDVPPRVVSTTPAPTDPTLGTDSTT